LSQAEKRIFEIVEGREEEQEETKATKRSKEGVDT
jgi:hypothetical protein